MGALLTLPIFAQKSSPQLWYWHHSLLNNSQAVQSSKALIDKAFSYGYTGVAFWDLTFDYIGYVVPSGWDPSFPNYMKEVMNYAVSKGMKVIGPVSPFGYSNDILKYNPSWAEAQRVIGTQFQVNSARTQLQLINTFPGLLNSGFESGKVDWFDLNDPGVGLDTTVAHSGVNSTIISNATGNGRIHQLFNVKPWRQYHLRFWYKSSSFQGYAQFSVFDPSNNSIVRVTDQIRASGTQNWTAVDYAFNSQDSNQLWIYLGVYGGNSGALWLDDIQIDETALVYVTRDSARIPLQVYDPNNSSTVYQEGTDYNYISDPRMTSPVVFSDSYHTPPIVTLPGTTSLKAGQTVAMDFHAAFVAPGQMNMNMCVSSTNVASYLNKNAQAVASVMPPGGGLLLSYDEIRQFNSCALCRAKNMTPAQLLAWHVEQSVQRYNSPLYVWSDMFDPYHNAHDHYFYVEGDLTPAPTAVPSNVIIMNWNLGNLSQSLAWFAGTDPRKPMHQQIIAGYFDSGNGAQSAQDEVAAAKGIPGVLGLMYTTWNDDYSQLQSFAQAAKLAWPKK